MASVGTWARFNAACTELGKVCAKTLTLHKLLNKQSRAHEASRVRGMSACIFIL